MLSTIAKALLAATAMAPVGMSYAWVAYNEGKSSIAFWLFLGCMVLFFACNFLLQYAIKNLESEAFTTQSVECADKEIIASLLLYLLPLFTAQFGALNWQVWLPAIIFFVAVVGTGYCFHFNPILSLQGWHFYKVSTPEGVTYLLITKKHIKSVAGQIRVGQLTEYIVLDLEVQ